jgi:multidrug resistance protein
MKSRIISVTFVVIATTMIGVGIIAPLMPLYAQQLGATGLQLGIVFAAFAATRMIFTPLFGRISDRYGRKPFLLTGLVVFTFLSLGYIWSRTVLDLTVVRLLHGASSALVIPIAFAYVGDLTPENEEGKYMGLLNIAIFIGMGIGPFAGGKLADLYSIRAAFWALFGFGAIASLLVLILMPDVRIKQHDKHVKPPTLRRIMADPLVGGLFTIRAGSAVRRAIVMAFLPAFADYVGLTKTDMGSMISIFIVAAALMQYPAGLLADRFNKTKIVLVGELLATASFALFPLIRTFPHLMAVGFIAGIAGGLAMPSILAITTEVGRDYGMASMMGLFDAAMGFGMLFGALTAGAVMDIAGVRTVFYYGVAIGFVAIFVFAILARKQRRQVQSGGASADAQ